MRGALSGFGASAHLNDDTDVRIHTQPDCCVLQLGETLSRVDIYITSQEQVDKLRRALAEISLRFDSQQGAEQ